MSKLWPAQLQYSQAQSDVDISGWTTAGVIQALMAEILQQCIHVYTLIVIHAAPHPQPQACGALDRA